jgi:hypothetical protein
MQSNQSNTNSTPIPTQSSIEFQSSPPLMTTSQPDSGLSLTRWVKRSLNLTTPKILRRSLFGLWGLSLVWVPLSINAIQTQRNAVKTIAKDSIPSVILAQRIVDAMSDMDASVANALLDPNRKALLIQDGSSQTLDADQKDFNKRRGDLAERLTQAAKNITVPDEEPVIRKITLNFGDYLAYVERAQAAHAIGNRALALQQYQLAAKLLDETLIPEAYKLREINSKVLENQYLETKNLRIRALGSLILFGLTTIGGLIMLQLFLTRRTQRVLNPALLGATAIAVIFGLSTISLVRSTGEKLRVLKEDSYNSLLALRKGRSLMYIANSSESRYLLDQANQDIHEKSFFQATDQVFTQSQSQDLLRNSIQGLEQGNKKVGIGGEFVVAIQNITFPKERQALTVMMQEFQAYMAIDQQIRDLAQRNQRQAALALCLGESNDKFEAFKKSMDAVIEINQDVFGQAEKTAMRQLDGFELKATIALFLIASLLFFGLQPRLKEYS